MRVNSLELRIPVHFEKDSLTVNEFVFMVNKPGSLYSEWCGEIFGFENNAYKFSIAPRGEKKGDYNLLIDVWTGDMDKAYGKLNMYNIGEFLNKMMNDFYERKLIIMEFDKYDMKIYKFDVDISAEPEVEEHTLFVSN